MKKKNDENKKSVTKAFFAWEDEKEEKWLEQMAAEGWKLISVAPYVYHFERSAPEKVVFRLDYKLTNDKDYQEYLGLFKDSGWELFATFSNWHYFKINPENHETPEIYNSGKAKAQKYRRLLTGLIPLFPIYLVVFNPALRVSETSSGVAQVLLTVARIFLTFFVLFVGFFVIKILSKIKQLESDSKE